MYANKFSALQLNFAKRVFNVLSTIFALVPRQPE
jgi:hypothetical protein